MSKIIEEQCDELIWKFYTIKQDSGRSISKIEATKCAILHQTGIVDELEKVYKYHQSSVVIGSVKKAKQILETLKSRVK